ncbi:hypothetical protein C474_06392 [Halogeometricum pallidum JCM 14848]|uniref:Fido domain-containing protein n=1 Tax=Halogeometricum pallidum JCM 14848 TaxID=1227487 RepID=M0DAB7_HALPD|nr:type II toxin-antitoxin system death-on-curing family toxin [Halogeometricum pallidum]ELZ32430.1 hypothetical protein C474_06392 [Halogeometricum pallidum JCM 14848]
MAVVHTVDHIQEGHFGHAPESLHEKSYQLLRLIAANRPFVDSNKRTALMSTRIFYALNGRRFNYDREIKEILKALATDESSVDEGDVINLDKHEEIYDELATEWDGTLREGRGRTPGKSGRAVLRVAVSPSMTSAGSKITRISLWRGQPR